MKRRVGDEGEQSVAEPAPEPESKGKAESQPQGWTPRVRNAVLAVVFALGFVSALYLKDASVLFEKRVPEEGKGGAAPGGAATSAPPANVAPEAKGPAVKVFTVAELARFDGKGGASPVLLAVLGEVIKRREGGERGREREERW